jgi:hypothetical protein
MEYVHTTNDDGTERIDIELSKSEKGELASQGVIRHNGENGKVVIKFEE